LTAERLISGLDPERTEETEGSVSKAPAPPKREAAPRARAAPHRVPHSATVARPEERDEELGRRGLTLAGGARTRILTAYVILLALSAVLAILAFREAIVGRLEDRVDEALQQEIQELDRLVTEGRDPATGRPFASVRALFDVYLRRNVPGQEEAMLAFVDGQLYRSVLSRFPLDRMPAPQTADWEALSSSDAEDRPESATGSFETELGTARFHVAQVQFGGRIGAFVVTILPADEYRENRQLLTYGVAGALGVLMIASVFAWFIAGRVLAPVRVLTETARSISQSDLTQRVKVYGAGDAAIMARSFNAMLDRLESVFRSQRSFVQDASHELRDPLTICRGHLELLGPDPDENRLTLALVMDELDRMGRIVDDLQLLAESEHPDFVRNEWMELSQFTHELIAKASALASRSWKIDAVGEGAVLADRHRLTEAVMNLVHNALQHTVADDTIAIGTALDDNEARVWVRDTGSGIAIADQARIFERFARGTGAQSLYRGSGLGLAIVRAIAESHGGNIELESRLGEGSTFTIVIPRIAGDRDGDGDGAV
jgi:two-component system, OmpR family, sensor kinase